MTEQSFRIRLAIVTAVGAAWRIGYLVVAKLGTPLLLNDSLYFSIQAGRNSEGDWFREGLTSLPGAEHGPLTSLWLTPWSLGSGDDVGWQRLAMTLLGIATVAVLGLVARRLAGPLVGLVAAGIAAVYPNLWINDSLVMSESLACLLVALALFVALGLDAEPTARRCAVLGVIVGLACLTRSELGLLAIGFAGLAWWRGAGRPRRFLAPLLLLGATAVTVAPWVVYNSTQFERTVLLSSNDGTTLLGANCARTYYDDIGGWDIRCLGPVPTDDNVDASVRSRERRDIAVHYARQHLPRVPVVVMARVGRSLDVYGLGSLVALDRGEEKAAWAVWAGIVCFWVLAAFAIVGWRVLGRAAETARSRWWLAVPLLAVVVTTVLFYGAHRIRAPAEPAVVVLAAVGFVAARDLFRSAGRSSGGATGGDEAPRVMAHSIGVTALDTTLDAKLTSLRTELLRLERVVVAFSGGADSALLANVAHTTLGPGAAHAVTAVSPSLAGSEREDCRVLAAEWGLRWTPVETAEMERAAYRRNDTDRCFHCKAELMDVVAPIAAGERATVVLGVNVDDLGDHRPGQQAATDAGAAFPLVVAGFTKDEVREVSRQLGLRTWDKPAAACLASRVPYGTEVTVTVLSRVERAEAALHDLGFAQVRVRHYGDTARIEVALDEIARVVDARAVVAAAVRAAGYRYVTLDLEGFRSGNLNG